MQFFAMELPATVVRGAKMSRSRFAILLVFIALFCPLIALCYHHLMSALETSVAATTDGTQGGDPCVAFLVGPPNTINTNVTSPADPNQDPDFNANRRILNDLGQALFQAFLLPVQKIILSGQRFVIGFMCAQILNIASTPARRLSVASERRYLTAVASINLWKNLSLMESVDNIFVDSINSEFVPILLLGSDASTNMELLLRKLTTKTELILDHVEAMMMNDEALAPLFEKEKSKARTTILSTTAREADEPSSETNSDVPMTTSLPTEEVKSEVENMTSSAPQPTTEEPSMIDYIEYYDDPMVLYVLVRRQILTHLRMGYDARLNDFAKFRCYIMCQAVIQMAKGARRERVQEIFDAAVQKTLESIDLISTTSYYEQTDKIIFPMLKEKLQKEFNREFVAYFSSSRSNAK